MEYLASLNVKCRFATLRSKNEKLTLTVTSMCGSGSGVDETLKVFVSSAEVKKEDYERAVIIIVVKDDPTK